MKHHLMKKKASILGILGLILMILTVLSFGLGRYPISIRDIWDLLWNGLYQDAPIDPSKYAIFYHVRLPRIVLSILVGSALSVSGCCYQGIFRNPLVSSDVIGASSGAAFGAVLAILMGFESWAISLHAFSWSIGAVMLVYGIGRCLKQNPILGLVLAGIMVSSLFHAGVSFLKLIADPNNELPAITYWLMGSLAGAKQIQILPASGLILIGILPIWILRWRINLLTMGDDEAKSMGVDVHKMRLIIILCATLITASSIAVAGMIGWISLIIPHFSRMMVGNDYRVLLPTSILLGADFVLLLDNVSRLASSAEIPIGILTALIGAPFYLYLLLREGRSKS